MGYVYRQALEEVVMSAILPAFVAFVALMYVATMVAAIRAERRERVRGPHPFV
jgi:hypothetical protein